MRTIKLKKAEKIRTVAVSSRIFLVLLKKKRVYGKKRYTLRNSIEPQTIINQSYVNV